MLFGSLAAVGLDWMSWREWRTLGAALMVTAGGIAIALLVALSRRALDSDDPRHWQILILLAATVFLFFVWPTPYEYQPGPRCYMVRINRITGTAELVPIDECRPSLFGASERRLVRPIPSLHFPPSRLFTEE